MDLSQASSIRVPRSDHAGSGASWNGGSGTPVAAYSVSRSTRPSLAADRASGPLMAATARVAPPLGEVAAMVSPTEPPLAPEERNALRQMPGTSTADFGVAIRSSALAVQYAAR